MACIKEPLGLGEENTNPDLKILERDFAFVFYGNPKLDYEWKESALQLDWTDQSYDMFTT